MKTYQLFLSILIVFILFSCQKEKSKDLLTPFLLTKIQDLKSKNIYTPNPNETPIQATPPDEEVLATDQAGNPVTPIVETYKDFVPPEPIDFGIVPENPTSVPECPTELPCTATVLKPNVDVDRYEDIVIQFSHSMDLSTICTGTNNLAFSDPGSIKNGTLNQSAISLTVGGSPFEATCRWGSFRKLIIDPVSALPQYSIVEITITNVARVYGGTVALTNAPIVRTFRTVPRFSMTHSINGYIVVSASGNDEVREVSGNPRGGVVIARTGPSTLNVILSSTFVLNSDKVSYVKLYKLGANLSGPDNAPGYTYTVCASACTPAELASLANLNLSTISPTVLRPTDGANTYVFEIGTSFKKFYKSVSFVYAPLVADPYASISNAAKLVVDNGTWGLDRIAKLLERFILSNGSMTTYSRTGTFTSSATTLTVNSATSLAVGMGVTGTNIDFGTTVTSISGTTIGLSKPTLGAGTNVPLTFHTDNFKIGGKVFDNFYKEPVWNYNSPTRRSHCIDYSGAYNGFDYMRAYGDHGSYTPTLGAPFNSSLYGDGYCGPDGTVADFVGTGFSTTFDIDGYIDDITIPNTTLSSGVPVQNIATALVPNSSGDLVVDINGKKAFINLEAIARNRGTCWIIIPVMGGGNLFRFDAPVELNQGATVPAFRLSRAKTILSIDSTGSLKLAVKTPYAPNDPITGNFYIQPWTDNLAVGSMSLVSSTSWVAEIFGFITEGIANNMVPQIKPKIVQGVLRDILEKVAPSVLNAVVSQVKVGPQLTCNSTNGNATLTSCTSTTSVSVGMAVYGPNIQPNTVVSSKTVNSITMNKTATSTLIGGRYTFDFDGINVSLPTYLPYPLNAVSLNVGVQLEQTTNAIGTTASNGYLEADVKLGIVANNANNNPRPPTPQGTDSFTYFKNPSDKLNTQRHRLGTSPKFQHALVSLHPDAVNQAIYHLWKSGSINLTLNRSFANEIATNQWAGDTTGYRNSTRLLQIFETLLRAESMIKILAPGKTSLRVCPIGVSCSGLTNTVLMENDDDIEITLNPVTLPVVKPLPLSELTQFTCPDEASQCVIPRVRAELVDIELSIKGRKCTTRNPTSKLCTVYSGVDYNLVKVRASLSSRADVSFVPFSNPKCNPSLNPGLAGCDTSQNGLTAVSLSISSSELKYTLEVLEGQANNPQGLSPQGIWEILDPTVKSLIVPLVNYILEEIPLPRMAGCGLTLENPDGIANGAGLKILPVRVSDYVAGKEFILANTRLGSYVFSGDCRL